MDTNFILKETCWACPEQYDVFLNEKQVGYLRLRHGWFRCDYPECGQETIYEVYADGDGRFYDDERDHYLREALAAIAKKLGLGEDFGYKIYNDI